MLFFGAIPRVPNFAEIYARGGRGLLQTAPGDLIPPWGHTPGGAAGGRGHTLARSGRTPAAAGTPLGGRQGPGWRGQRPSGRHTGRGGGFRRAQAGRTLGGGAAEKRGGAFGRARRACGGRGGAGRPFPGGGVAPAAQGRTEPNPAGRAGGRGGGFSGGAGTRWAAAGPRSGGGGKGGSFCAGVCRVIAPARGGGRKKAAFSHIRKRVFRPLFFVGSELFLPENLVLFIGLLFRPRRAMNVSRAGKGEDRRPGAAAAGGKSRRAQGRKPSEKPDFRHRD